MLFCFLLSFVHSFIANKGFLNTQTADNFLKSGSVMLYIAFCWCSLVPSIPFEGKITANIYNVIVTDHLYPILKGFYPDGSGFFMRILSHASLTVQ